MEADPSLVTRIGDWCWAVVWNWKGLVAGLSLAIGFTPQLLGERPRQWLDKKLRPDCRRHALIGLCLLFFLISSFQIYDDTSMKLRHVSSQLPDFDSVTEWSVSFQLGPVSGMFSSDIKDPFVLTFHRCRFVNLSATQRRILDLRVDIPTNDPRIPLVTLNTENMPFHEYRQSLTNAGMAVDEKALGRKEPLLKTPIDLEPGQLIEGTIELDINDQMVKQEIRNVHPEHILGWLHMGWFRLGEATVSVTDQRSDVTKTIKMTQAYNAATEAITKTGRHF